MTNHTITTERDLEQCNRAARLRGIRFLAGYALAARDTYGLRVGEDGTVGFQGCSGALRGLVDQLDAEPVEDPADGFQEWTACARFGGGVVRVELTEDAGD